MAKLNPKQAVFVTEYIKDFNATQAALRSGYSKKTAYSIGQENLTKPEIKSEINKILESILADNKDIALNVVRECKKIAFSKLSDVADFDNEGLRLKPSNEIDDSAIESISFDVSSSESGYNVRKKIKLHDKLKALEILAKYTGLYKDSQDINLNTNIVYLDSQDENL